MEFTREMWLEAFAMLEHDERQRLGPPEQISDEMLAEYVAGALSDEEQRRVHEFMFAYDELVEIVLMIRAANEFVWDGAEA